MRAKRVVNTFTGLGSAFSGSGPRAAARRILVTHCFKHLLRPSAWRVTFQNCEDMQQLLDAGMVRSSCCDVIRGSGVNPTVFQQLNERAGTPTIMLPSRMIWPKGIGEFVEAARLLKQTDTQARFVLVGDTDGENPRAVPTAQLKKWNDEGIVQWWGRRTDMPQIIGRSSVVVLPTYYGEGLPKVLLEAAACGKPIITTDVRGCREIVRDKVNGILVPPSDVESLASAMWRLIDQPDLRHRMGLKGRERVLREFTAQRVAEQTIEVYREMLERVL